MVAEMVGVEVFSSRTTEASTYRRCSIEVRMLTNVPPVIVIDDDPAFRAALKDALQLHGFRACAIEPCGPVEPRAWDVGCALVVLDLFMAGRDGLGWIEFFGTLQRPPELILISGRSEEFLNAAWAVAEARGIRVRGALKKPLDISDLVTLLQEAGAYSQADAPSQGEGEFLHAVQAAIANDHLAVYFQPQVDVATLRFAGAEALLSGEVPNYGAVHPAVIVAVAATIPQLSRRLACHTLRAGLDACLAWTRNGLEGRVSVNLPSAVLADDSFLILLDDMVDSRSLPRSALVIELPENDLYDTSALVIQNLARLRMRGYGIALDDIGTSYSGLVRLAELPVSEIKIDRRLVQQARRWKKARKILESLMVLADTIGLAVTVEGVETMKDLEALAGHPQANIQGFLISPKVPLAKLLDLAPKFSAHLAADTASINATVAAHD